MFISLSGVRLVFKFKCCINITINLSDNHAIYCILLVFYLKIHNQHW